VGLGMLDTAADAAVITRAQTKTSCRCAPHTTVVTYRGACRGSGRFSQLVAQTILWEGRNTKVNVWKPAAVAAALTACGTLAACGSSSTGPTASPGPSTVSQTAAPAKAAAAVTVRLPKITGVGVARKACRGVTAERVRSRYLPAARANAVSRDRLFLKSAAHPPERLRQSSSYPYLAARVYAMSVPAKKRAGAYAGCSFELSMKKNVKESGR
jgi:hypothetical protein